MNRIRFLLDGFYAKIYRWRWGIVATLSALIFVMEILEHHPTAYSIFNNGFLLDVAIKALAFPLLIGTVMSLRSTKKQLFRAVSQLDLQRVIRQQLANARDWEELVTILLQIPRMILPVTKTRLIIYDPSKGEFDSTYEWTFEGKITQSGSLPFISTCLENRAGLAGSSYGLVACNCFTSSSTQEMVPVFCLPLLQGERKLGLYHLQLSQETTIRPYQVKIFNEITPDLALAVDRFRLWHSVAGQVSQSEVERQRMARYLHDTLAHNLAYMRLKLDELSGDTSPQEADTLRHEIHGLLQIANQSYEEVRNSLVELREQDSPELTIAVEDLSARIHQRAHFEIELIQQGDPVDLPSHVSRQILYIIREVLRNVEKHARAQKVIVRICWSRDHLLIVTSDDGRGFDPDLVGMRRDSQGLQILKECAAELNGTINIASKPGMGTQVSLSLPLFTIKTL